MIKYFHQWTQQVYPTFYRIWSYLLTLEKILEYSIQILFMDSFMSLSKWTQSETQPMKKKLKTSYLIIAVLMYV